MKVDFHVHSIESSDGTATLCHIAMAAAKAGLDAVCICDHNKQTLEEPVFMEGVWLLPGCEFSAEREHILGILPDKKLNVKALCEGENLPSPKAVIDEIHACGGIAVVAHPYAHGAKDSWSYDNLKAVPDALECANARAWMKDSEANEKAKKTAADNCLPMTGGSDSHLTDELGNAYTVVDCGDINGIKQAVKDGRTEAVLVNNTKRIYKGYSMLEKRNKSGRSGEKMKGLIYLTKCWLYDLLKK